MNDAYLFSKINDLHFIVLTVKESKVFEHGLVARTHNMPQDSVVYVRRILKIAQKYSREVKEDVFIVKKDQEKKGWIILLKVKYDG